MNIQNICALSSACPGPCILSSEVVQVSLISNVSHKINVIILEMILSDYFNGESLGLVTMVTDWGYQQDICWTTLSSSSICYTGSGLWSLSGYNSDGRPVSFGLIQIGVLIHVVTMVTDWGIWRHKLESSSGHHGYRLRYLKAQVEVFIRSPWLQIEVPEGTDWGLHEVTMVTDWGVWRHKLVVFMVTDLFSWVWFRMCFPKHKMIFWKEWFFIEVLI